MRIRRCRRPRRPLGCTVMSLRRAPLTFALALSGCGGPAVYAEGLQALRDGEYERAGRYLARAFRSSRQGRVGMELARARVLSGGLRSGLRAAGRAWRMGVRGSDATEFARLLPAGEWRELWFERALEALEETGRGRSDLDACLRITREYEAFPEVVLRACICARRRLGEFALGRSLSGLGFELEGDDDAAEREYRSSLARDPGCLEAVGGLGLLLARKGRKERAASLSLELLRRNASARARLIAAGVALAAGKVGLAEEILKPLPSSGGESGGRAAALLSRTRSLPGERLAFLLDARRRGFDSPELRLELAETYASLGRASELLRNGKDALRKFPSSGILARRLAELGEAWGEAELVGAALRVLGPRARARLAEELARSGRGKEALRVARSLKGGGSTARGLALASCGRVRAAARILQKARDVRALHELAWLKLSLGELDEALRAWRSALAREPGFEAAELELRRWKNLRGFWPGGGR